MNDTSLIEPFVHYVDEDVLVRVVVSRLIGAASGERRFLRPLCVGVAGICWIDGGRLAGEPAPVVGWPDPRTTLRRLRLEPAAIDGIWQRRLAEDGEAAVLPGALVEALLPSRVVPLIAEVAAMGPAAAQERLERFCRLETLRPGRRYAGRTEPVSAGTVETILTSSRRLFTELRRLALGPAAGALPHWRLLPPAVAATALGATPAALDRSAPPLPLVRASLACLDMRTRAGSSRDRRRALRDRALLGLLACTGARIGAVAGARVADIDARHRFPDGTLAPAIRLHPGKSLPAHCTRWKGLPEELHAWIHAHVRGLHLAPEQPLFPRGNEPAATIAQAPESLTRILSGTNGRPGLLAHDSGRRGYSAHTLSHLAARLTHHAARTRPFDLGDWPSPTPEAAVAALLDHSHGRDPLGYLDTTTESSRELIARAATHTTWDALRNHSPDNAHTTIRLTQLRAHRQSLFAHPGATSDQRITTLVQTAAITAAIDDLEHQ
jgi:integrase